MLCLVRVVALLSILVYGRKKVSKAKGLIYLLESA